ncbi:MAG TPA: hypothetical protein VIL86_07565 [Tepidisphaeraceae bacterium]|jgi:hypothetical protein
MTDLLFDTPWWLPVGIAVIGVALLVAGNRRTDKQMLRYGAAALLAAVALALISHFVVTDKEQCIDRTKQIVHAIEKQDWKTLESLLDSRASVKVLGSVVYHNRDEILRAAQSVAGEIKDVRIQSIEARQVQTSITIGLTVWSAQRVTMDQTVPTNWQLDWEKSASGWTLRTATYLKAGEQAGDIGKYLPKP